MKHLKRIISIFLVLLFIFACGCRQTEPIDSSGKLTVYFFDVGQADSSLLIFPDGLTVLIDCGNKADGPLIADFLKSHGIKSLDYFIATHPHEDHIGGMEDIFLTTDIKNVCAPDFNGNEPKSKYQNSLMENIEAEKANLMLLNENTNIISKENYNIKTLSPSKNSIYSDINDYSLCLLINCYTNTLLFTGDAEEPAERDMLTLPLNLDADILKVGHHGSQDSSKEGFLLAVTPKVSIISSGKGNSYGHPRDETIKRLENIGSEIYRTDTVGTVIAKCYEDGFNIETDKTICLDGDR